MTNTNKQRRIEKIKDVVQCLDQMATPVTIVEVAESTGMSRSLARELLHLLADAGFVYSTRTQLVARGARESYLYTLTAKGHHAAISPEGAGHLAKVDPRSQRAPRPEDALTLNQLAPEFMKVTFNRKREDRERKWPRVA